MAISQGPTNEQRALEYYKHAAEFTDAYEKLSRADVHLPNISKDLLQPTVKLLILGHALELIMKGWLVLYEGNPVSLTGKQKRALAQTGQPAPKTLIQDYGHDLEQLAADVVKYYPPLQPYLDKTIPMVDRINAPLLDEVGQQRKKSIIEHLNSSYWAGGARQYEYPEATQVTVGHDLAFLHPLDAFADFVSTCRHELLNAIVAQNGGAVPQQYQTL